MTNKIIELLEEMAKLSDRLEENPLDAMAWDKLKNVQAQYGKLLTTEQEEGLEEIC